MKINYHFQVAISTGMWCQDRRQSVSSGYRIWSYGRIFSLPSRETSSHQWNYSKNTPSVRGRWIDRSRSDHRGCRLKINIKEINKYEREIRVVEKKDLQAAGVFQEEEENGWKNRVEKVNATRRRIGRFVCTYARGESSEEALRLVGREGGRIARRRDFWGNGRRKPRPDEKPFFIFREQRSQTESKKLERDLPSSFEKKSILFLKKIRSKFFLIFDRKQSFEKGENLKREQKKKRRIRQSAEGKVRYYGLTSWCIPVRLSVSDFSKTLHDSWKLVEE